MSAYNWIELTGMCPACQSSQNLRAQTHVASSFSGDERGRFSNRSYRLGEAMAWWLPNDSRYPDWFKSCDPAHMSPVQEACYSECVGCRAELCVVVEFDGPTPIRAVAVTPASQWPEGYSR